MKFIIILALLSQLLLSDEKPTVIEPITVEASPIVYEQSSNYSRQELDMRNIDSLSDLSSVVPSFSISNYGSRDVAFTTYRGQINSMSTASPIGVYIDDIPLTFVNTFLAHDLYNISEVSVLKGPQGFSTGLGAEAGIIELKMDNSFVKKTQISTQAGVANYNEKSISLHAKTPLTNGVISVDGLYKKRDGFTKNIYNDSTIDGQETKALSLRMVKDLGAFRLTLLGMNDVDDDGAVPFNSDLTTPFEMNQNVNGYVKQNGLLGSVKLEYFGDDFSLKSITSLQHHHTKELLDGDRTAQDLLTINTKENLKEFNQELGYTIQQQDWKLTGGAFYAYQYEHTYMEHHKYDYLGTSGYQEWQKSMPEKNFALFSTYSTYMSDHLTMSAGLRYIWNKKDFDSTITNYFPIEIPAYGFVNVIYPHAVISKEWQKVLPKLRMTYKTAPKSALYVQYAQGFKNGGYNYDDYNPNPVTYDPEHSETYEIGYDFAPNRSLSINTTLYATYVKNLQVETIRPDITSYVDNAAKAEIYGFENELHYAVTDNFKVHSSISFIQAKFKDYVSDSVDYSGNKLLNVPAYTCELASEYDFMKNYYLFVVLKSNGKTYFDKANSVSQSSYAYVNTKIGFRSKKLLWSIYARNIFDKRYLNYVVSSGGLNAYNFGEPRRFGASLTYNF